MIQPSSARVTPCDTRHPRGAGRSRSMGSTHRSRSSGLRLAVTGVVASAVLATAWSPRALLAESAAAGQHAHHQSGQRAMVTLAPTAGMTDSAAANLRVDLNRLLVAHAES